MANSAQTHLNRLLRGVSTYHVETIRQAWRAVLDDPDPAIPLIREKLCSQVWHDIPRGPSAQYLGVLLALLHELDGDAFRHEIQRLQSEPVHALHRHTIDMMAKRFGDQVYGMIGDDVPVYIARDIADPEVIFRHLVRWSQTPDLALSTVTRIDIIARRPEMDYLGRYNLFYDSIILTWESRAPHLFGRWWLKIRAELTFYHEIGHHYFQHSEGGQVAEQEREADAYQMRMFRNAHPIFFAIIRIAFSPIWMARKVWALVSGGRNRSDL